MGFDSSDEEMADGGSDGWVDEIDNPGAVEFQVGQDVPWAFDDHPAIRNAYIRVFLGVSFDGMTHKAASLMLNGFVNGTFNLAASTGLDIPGVERFARTIGTVEKRLGVSTEGFIHHLLGSLSSMPVFAPSL